LRTVFTVEGGPSDLEEYLARQMSTAYIKDAEFGSGQDFLYNSKLRLLCTRIEINQEQEISTSVFIWVHIASFKDLASNGNSNIRTSIGKQGDISYGVPR
jgi:hypothetical protein